MFKHTKIAIAALLSLTVVQSTAQAGLFTLPHYLQVKSYTVGIEPELRLETPNGFGINIKYNLGVTDSSNLMALLGTGSGNRLFRFGGAYTFDFFPDTDNQPGLGLALQGIFFQNPNSVSVEFSGIPYVHKNFVTEDASYEPYLGVPLALNLSGGNYTSYVTLAPGIIVHFNKKVMTNLELGINLANSSVYVSGGVAYSP